MPVYTHLKWEAGGSGWELYGVEHIGGGPFNERIALLAWVFEVYSTGQWRAVVFDAATGDFGPHMDLDSLEEAQAWCAAYVRTA